MTRIITDILAAPAAGVAAFLAGFVLWGVYRATLGAVAPRRRR